MFGSSYCCKLNPKEAHPVEKKLHSSRENVRYMLHNWWEWDRKSIWFCALRVPALVLLPMLTALIPKLMIDCITQSVSVPIMIGLIAVMSALVAALSWVDPFLQGKMTGVAQAAAIRYSILTFRKAMTADYENMESMEGREKFERGRGFALYGRYSDSQAFYEIIVSLCANATGIVSYLAVLSALRPTMLLLIAATCVGEFFLVRYTAKAELDTRKKTIPSGCGLITFIKTRTTSPPVRISASMALGIGFCSSSRS